jgi:CHAD domain-containing protein
MATHESIQEYYLHQQSNIGHYLEMCVDSADAELIHELRLSIKKLRAFNIMAKPLFEADFDEHFQIKHKVNKLYKLAGELRDTQVQMNMLVVFEEQEGIDYPEFRNWLLSREKKKMSRFKRKSKHVVPPTTASSNLSKINQILAQTSDEAVLAGMEKVLIGLFLKARKLSEGNINNENMHRIRINTKQLRYILNIVKNCFPDFEFKMISADSLRDIEAAAGQWHDCLVRVEYLGKCLEKVKLTDEEDLLKYHELVAAFKKGLKAAYEEACQISKSILLSGNQRIELPLS